MLRRDNAARYGARRKGARHDPYRDEEYAQIRRQRDWVFAEEEVENWPPARSKRDRAAWASITLREYRQALALRQGRDQFGRFLPLQSDHRRALQSAARDRARRIIEEATLDSSELSSQVKDGVATTSAAAQHRDSVRMALSFLEEVVQTTDRQTQKLFKELSASLEKHGKLDDDVYGEVSPIAKWLGIGMDIAYAATVGGLLLNEKYQKDKHAKEAAVQPEASAPQIDTEKLTDAASQSAVPQDVKDKASALSAKLEQDHEDTEEDKKALEKELDRVDRERVYLGQKIIDWFKSLVGGKSPTDARPQAAPSSSPSLLSPDATSGPESAIGVPPPAGSTGAGIGAGPASNVNKDTANIPTSKNDGLSRNTIQPADVSTMPPSAKTEQPRISATTASNTASVNPKLLNWVAEASKTLPEGWKAKIESGYRPSSSHGVQSFHPKGEAVDIGIYNEKGQKFDWYQNPNTYAIYQRFAHEVKSAQERLDPGANLRWGGYFSGPIGKYGAMDLMHFDTGPSRAMAAGSWEQGLKPEWRKQWGVPYVYKGEGPKVKEEAPFKAADQGDKPRLEQMSPEEARAEKLKTLQAITDKGANPFIKRPLPAKATAAPAEPPQEQPKGQPDQEQAETAASEQPATTVPAPVSAPKNEPAVPVIGREPADDAQTAPVEDVTVVPSQSPSGDRGVQALPDIGIYPWLGMELAQ